MGKKTTDARGQLCPKPLIMTKNALKDFEGDLEVLIDNQTAFENVKRFLTDNGKTFTTASDGKNYTILVSSDGTPAEVTSAENYCTIPSVTAGQAKRPPHVICFKSDLMGEGDEALGRILIQAFCNTIKEAEPLPSAMVFYNSGVRLTARSSPVLPALKELEEGGIRILVCGTCADYYEINDQIAAGIISNMYDITSCLTKAGHIIIP
ncbi:MAG: sulfurtransferase-like selenium metabolism protein YedF [Spirochaetales bacterium]|nr:sulfurtransferase-like selenium metabolism protein YedF [Spirochaetales bacterium]